ncbi:Hypp8542 [Branchiostoma lanceolatum]|uniref:Hypp8542 protein n=1 Tax=Branchiostoma lanceolatum TaxID=7740 RepID=A0A8K0EFN7_BRALA|nr:Hypp8542 [Branchiostoma lanceolatum]
MQSAHQGQTHNHDRAPWCKDAQTSLSLKPHCFHSDTYFFVPTWITRASVVERSLPTLQASRVFCWARTWLRTEYWRTGEAAANRRVFEPKIPEFDARARRGPRRERFHGLILADCQPCKRLSDSDQDKTTQPGVSSP